jgi:hypothetical protein
MDSRSVDIGIVSDPGLAEDVGAAVAGRLAEALQQRGQGEVDWRVHHRSHPLATGAQTRLADIAAAEVPVEPEWDVTVLLTDLPRRDGTDPVEIETSADRRVVVVSLPALGALRLNSRAERVIVSAVAEVLDPSSPASQHPVSSRIHPRLRLLVGMVRANRPWLLFSGLSRSLAGVFGTAALVLLDNVGWQLGDSLGPGRLGGIAVLSILALTAWLIIDHELWERPSDAQAKQLARLYNTTTAVTLLIGIVCLYFGLFIVLTIVSVIVLDPQVLQTMLGHTPTWAGRLGIVWFATSAAMVGGALGSGLEHDDVVRQAAYGERQRRRGEGYEHPDDQV